MTINEKVENIKKVLNGVDIVGLPVGGQISSIDRDNNLLGYNYLTVYLLLEILDELKKLNEVKKEVKESKEVEKKAVKTTKK